MDRSATDVGLVFSIKNRVSRILSVKSVLVGFFILLARCIKHFIDGRVLVCINQQVAWTL